MKTILVVDDNDAIREVLCDALDLEGYAALPARDGAQALSAALAERPDLILLDIALPDEEGPGVARRLREAGVESPIVVLTASRTGREQAEAMEAAAFLSKPFSLDKLLAAVETLLRAG